DLHVLGVTGPVSPFALTGGSCGPVPFTLAPGVACTLVFAFAPTSAGSFQGEATFVGNGGTVAVALGGSAGPVHRQAILVPGASPALLALLGLLVGLLGFVALRRY